MYAYIPKFIFVYTYVHTYIYIIICMYVAMYSTYHYCDQICEKGPYTHIHFLKFKDTYVTQFVFNLKL